MAIFCKCLYTYEHLTSQGKFDNNYTFSHISNDFEFNCRSQAIKCPSIQYHLAGTKKVQQALARSGVLDMFLTEAKKIEAIKEIFTGLYSLDFDEFGDQAVQMAMDEPERFVEVYKNLNYSIEFVCYWLKFIIMMKQWLHQNFST